MKVTVINADGRMTDWLLESKERLEKFKKDQLFIDEKASFVIQPENEK